MNRFALWLGLLAAACGMTSWRVGDSHLDVFAGVAAIAFFLSLLLTFGAAKSNAEDRWYRGRASAESVKTLTWRYAVGGEPFPSGIDSDELFLSRVESVLQNARCADLPASSGAQITDAMRTLRAAGFIDRRDAYLRDRIQDQRRWYEAKSSSNRASARKWLRLSIGVNVVGTIGATLLFLDVVHLGILGFAAAVTGAISAWVQLRQHESLSSAYALTSHELGLVESRLIDWTDEKTWATAVDHAENAISREHTMWLARRGRTS